MALTRSEAVGASIGVILLVVAAGLVATPLVAADDHTDPPAADETVELGENVDAWERAIFTLRADTDDAAMTVPNADWSIRNADNDETNLNRDPMAVYEPNQEITLEFDEADANKGGLFGETEVEVIRAHAGESDNATVPTSFDNMADVVTADGANDNATFESLGEHTMEDGTLTIEDTPNETGHYVYFVVTEDGEGFQVSDGNVSVESASTVVGVEHVAVRAGSGSVDAPRTVSAGDNATFEIDASELAGESTAHAVVLYDEHSYVRQYFVVDLLENVSGDFDIADDSGLVTSVERVNGVATLEDDFDRFGISVDDDTVTRSAGVASLVDFVAEEAGSETSPDIESTDDVRLDGSATVINSTAGTATVDVGTVENWSSGRYRWVAVSVGNSSQELAVTTGELTINQGQGQGPPDDAGDGDEGDDGDAGNGDEGDDGDAGDGGDGDDAEATDTATETTTTTETETTTPTETETETETATETETPTEAGGGGAGTPTEEATEVQAPGFGVVQVLFALVAAIGVGALVRRG